MVDRGHVSALTVLFAFNTFHLSSFHGAVKVATSCAVVVTPDVKAQSRDQSVSFAMKLI